MIEEVLHAPKLRLIDLEPDRGRASSDRDEAALVAELEKLSSESTALERKPHDESHQGKRYQRRQDGEQRCVAHETARERPAQQAGHANDANANQQRRTRLQQPATRWVSRVNMRRK